ncbi:hypothetical protein GGTG_12257 [Gaeumannomyces tritici R3-111a-1]|uniref:Uncharacterized protein n=1 Tax=Gaeumannomyces tritici (strain R3-111a-1) TaxID=644352 RepID=J3PFI2_GAET3|nr:hypothetical protein GGTG_12257 [Gaeumannomyces tritici R3-111a-1]EJT70084.1 hypothetical protein GGTG_12257 [Gaeumannomyces tritici R3-111a-1]
MLAFLFGKKLIKVTNLLFRREVYRIPSLFLQITFNNNALIIISLNGYAISVAFAQLKYQSFCLKTITCGINLCTLTLTKLIIKLSKQQFAQTQKRFLKRPVGNNVFFLPAVKFTLINDFNHRVALISLAFLLLMLYGTGKYTFLCLREVNFAA